MFTTHKNVISLETLRYQFLQNAYFQIWFEIL